jgi:two-component system phosphate regulon sensor histidine kinase PhoR
MPQHAAVELLHQRAYLSVTAMPLENPGAEGVLLVLHDLSEARRVNTMRREFVANVSHELRTPLAAIKATADTLDGGALDDPAAARQFLARIQREVDRMGRLVQELLELSRLESGQEKLNLEPASIQAAVDEAVERHRGQAEAAGVALNVGLPDSLPLVLTDGERLQQVLSNLLDNALKFTPRGGSVTVSTSQEPGKVWVSVSDTGAGIPDEHLPHVFERFYKVDRSRSGEGVGLGLAIARHIVHAHGGDIRVSSREGEGSTFSFSLPRA